MIINKEFYTDTMNVLKLDLSPFKGLMTEQISKWNILLISSVLEEWIKCQKSWIYLQRVFDSGDMSKIFLMNIKNLK